MYYSEVDIPGLLICSYKRYGSLAKILDSPALSFFPSITVAIDGVDEPEESEFLKLRYQEVISQSKFAGRIIVSQSEHHLGLYHGMRRSIDVAFERYETCVVLEEDCMPSKNIPRFISELDIQHKDLIRESHVCLSRHVPRNYFSGALTYTKYPFVWGWMASRDTWSKSRIEADELNRTRVLDALQKIPGTHKNFQDHWIKMFDACVDVSIARKSGNLDNLDKENGFISWALNSWATPYTLAYWTQNEAKPAIRPQNNFIRNVGFDSLATHTFRRPRIARTIDFLPHSVSGDPLKSKSELDLREDQEIFGISRSPRLEEFK